MANPSKQFEMIRLYPNLSSDPSAGKVGEIYYNTIFQSLRLCIDPAPIWTSVGASTDSFQDKNVLLIGGGVWTNTDNATSNTLTFTDTAYLDAAGLSKTSNQINSGSFDMVNGDILYVDLNRINVPTILTPVLAQIDEIPFNTNRLIIARCINGIIIVNDRISLLPNSAGSLDQSSTTLDTQNSNLKLIGGGVWSLSSSNTLSWNASAYIQVSGLPIAANTVPDSSFVLSPGDFIYASVYRSGTSNVVTCVVGNTVPSELDIFVIAYYDGFVAWLANGERLTVGESKEAGESVSIELLSSLGAANWGDRTGQLRLLSEPIPSNLTILTPINKNGIDSTARSLSIRGLDVKFEGARINWQSGTILDYASGTNVIGTFIAPATVIADEQFRWYSVSLVKNFVNANNEVEFNIAITPSIQDSDILKASYVNNSIPVGQVLLQNTGGTIQPISQSNIIQNTIGAGATGASGTNKTIQFNNLDALDGDSRFIWDSSKGAIGLNGLEYNVLSSPIAINDNQTSWTSIISFNKTSYPFVIIEYSVIKSGIYRVGRFLLTNDGTNVGFNDDYTETGFSGINFYAQISGSDVNVIYTSTATGSSGILKFSARKWS